MADSTFKCLVISDFNIDLLAGSLKNDDSDPKVEATVAPFGNVMQLLMDKDHDCWREQFDFAVVWTRPQAVIESFNRILGYEPVPFEKIMDEVVRYADLLLGLLDRVKAVFVPTWVLPTYDRGLGMLDMKSGLGVANTLIRMNLHLCERLQEGGSIYPLNSQKWIEVAGRHAFDPRLWYTGKIAFANQVFLEATKDIKAAWRGIRGGYRKLIILDLDDTLWGGIVGDIGWENIRLGGHDYIGEAYLDFQKVLKNLTRRGILLGIVSKNEESVALEAIKKHPEMVLKPDDFAGWRINWRDKAQNIADLLSDLNLGFNAAVFIDDNPVERDRVREALPEVFVPEWPADKMLYKSALLSLRCFEMPALSEEDLKRTKMYVADRKRKSLGRKIGSLDEWLASLEMKVEVDKLNRSNLRRAAQLLNKTNQMNLMTRRMTETELMAWAEKADHHLWTFRVSDKFGDSGLTGIASLAVEGDTGQIIDFILSCRIIGRKVEETILHTLVKRARSIKLRELWACHIPTDKNNPCLRFWKTSGFAEREGAQNTFWWDLRKDYPLPSSIRLEDME